MSKNLVIVESPAKAKTINKYLGKDYSVIASYGHVRDLIPREGAVDTESFEMKYEPIKSSKKHIDAIYKEARESDAILLATDPDREGEAISWHIYNLLKDKKLAGDKKIKRIAFHEITKNAIQKALEHPRDLSDELINAQQARRALDYLVGFNISPLLWKKIKRGLSAGRVQSPALRLIVERETEIEAFQPREYWSMEALTEKASKTVSAKLVRYQSKKVDQFFVNNAQKADEVAAYIEQAAKKELRVSSITKKERKRHPFAPFTTSTLQQDASRKLGFSAQRTMRVAQQLYEGIDIGGGEVGLITYMRTDSVSMAAEAVSEIRGFIEKHFPEALPPKANFYKTKSKNAQEAHEAIRPTSARRAPEQIKKSLTDDQYKLYRLIWTRTLASQMMPAIMDTVSVEFSAGEGNIFRASGSTIKKPGYLAVYQVGIDEDSEKEDEKILPPFSEGETVPLKEIVREQHFTKPPPRYTEASLIKTLEEYGIGRPSTYAAIISTLLQREYVTLENRRFKPTDMGKIVNKFLTRFFSTYVDYEFTAQLEDRLDAIARGEEEWKPLMKSFWKSFKKKVDETEKIPRSEINEARVLGTDPKSGKPVSVRMGRYGAMAQIGEAEDEEKPRFASLRPDQTLDTITLEEALVLFELPRELGVNEDGEMITANIGRYGPYVRVNKTFVSIKGEDPHTITLERALELIAENEEKKNNRIIKDFEDGVQILRGPYGPYITNGKKNARIPKGTEPESISHEQALEMIEKAPEKKARGRRRSKK
ncbi:MAG TPA: type I DNA topoisomerase [Caldithrix abyssi]|uniref:DNA topoisomerase 1 n=1 Tax=Caldithrix abyssi TaxID=187145 RepID=A0A7V5RMR2_CALAY|nr:type I DNA topoisomerase [Caldithrix abyssi]